MKHIIQLKQEDKKKMSCLCLDDRLWKKMRDGSAVHFYTALEEGEAMISNEFGRWPRMIIKNCY